MDDLENRINQLKSELVRIAELTGLNSHDTISCSQKLDELIIVYQKHLQNKNNNIPVLA
ncbi:MAG TPA: aspartyl-phosphate phosphatase Spo0E family protein [Bacillales bacterium]|nr:aspartyl-phosphate phosphatase Spo0E family protein [Bacillales bacterium]